MIVEKFSVEVVPITELASVEPLRVPLEQSVIDSVNQVVDFDEVQAIMHNLEVASRGEGDIYYAVAREVGGEVLGLMGLRAVGNAEDPMRGYALRRKAAELVNAYILRDERGLGIGTDLFNYLAEYAHNAGFEELVVNSGPRFKKQGWPFWTARFGPKVDTMKDKYGAGRDAPVWRKEL